MQAIVRKAKWLKEVGDGDNDLSDTCSCLAKKGPILDDDIEDLTRNFSEMTELN